MMKAIWFFLLAPVLTQAYPKIQSWRNSPIVVFEGDKNAVLKKDQELKSPFFAITTHIDELKLSLNTGSELEIYKNSKIQVYEVFEDPKQEHVIFLFDGTIRLKNSSAGKSKPNRLRTPFFDLEQPVDGDAIVELNMKEPSVEIRMVKGTWKLEFYSYEKKIELKAGQKVKFKGVLDSQPDQIKYDYLLNDKKIPKGELGAVEKFDLTQFAAEKRASESEMIKKEQSDKKKIQQAIAKKKAHDASFLCKNPLGNRDQCAWILDSDKCYRQRCNAGGEWGDRTERPVTKDCTKEFLVGPCDY